MEGGEGAGERKKKIKFEQNFFYASHRSEVPVLICACCGLIFQQLQASLFVDLMGPDDDTNTVPRGVISQTPSDAALHPQMY
jgi:hypothetical protein